MSGTQKSMPQELYSGQSILRNACRRRNRRYLSIKNKLRKDCITGLQPHKTPLLIVLQKYSSITLKRNVIQVHEKHPFQTPTIDMTVPIFIIK